MDGLAKVAGARSGESLEEVRERFKRNGAKHGDGASIFLESCGWRR
jgi:hypothetical protein